MSGRDCDATSLQPDLPPEYNAARFDATLAPVLAQLEGLLDAAEPLHHFMPAEGSPAQAEHDRQQTWAGDWGQTPIDNALTSIRLLYVAAESHICSIVVMHGSTRRLGIPDNDFDNKIAANLATADAVGIRTLAATKKTPRRLLNRPTATSLVAKPLLDDHHTHLGQTA